MQTFMESSKYDFNWQDDLDALTNFAQMFQ